MKVYRHCWIVLAALLGALGALEAALAVPVPVAVTVGLTSAVATAITVDLLRRRHGQSTTYQWAVVGAAGAGGGLALTGLTSLLGGSTTFWLVIALAATSPVAVFYLMRRVRSAWGPNPGRPTADSAPPRSKPVSQPAPTRSSSKPVTPITPIVATAAIAPPTTAAVNGLTDAELCWAWRTSYTALANLAFGADPNRRAHLVAVRQHYLDELERRNPAGFRRWLYAGARPASDPTRYITPAHRRAA